MLLKEVSCWVYVPRWWQWGAGCGAASVRSGQGCPEPDTASAVQLPLTHCWGRLSPTGDASGKSLSERVKSCPPLRSKEWGTGWDWETALQAPGWEQKEGRGCSRLPCSSWRNPCGETTLQLGVKREEEGTAERSCYGLTITPLRSSCRSGCGEGRGVRSEVEPGEKGGSGGRKGLCFSLVCTLLICKKLNWFSHKMSLFCPWW